MVEFQYEYMLQKYRDCLQLCYMDKDSFVYHIKTNNFYKDIEDDLEKQFDTPDYTEDARPLSTGKNNKVIGMVKDELSKKIMIEFVAHKKLDKKPEDKRSKGIKKCVVKKTLTFED